MKKSINVQYFASFRDQSGKSSEQLLVDCDTASELYEHVKGLYGFHLKPQHLRVAINENFSNLNQTIQEGDSIVFLPPVAGG